MPVDLFECGLQAIDESIEIRARWHETLGAERLELGGGSIALLPARRHLSNAAIGASSFPFAMLLHESLHDRR
jgi:hypothetical protein